MADLTVIILTFNEALHIARAIASVRPIAQRVVVVDSFSTDDTVELSRQAGAEVFQNKFLHQAQQFQWALDNVSVDTSWVMRLDADEIIEEDLQRNLGLALVKSPREVVAFQLKRKHIFMGRWIKHGGRYPLLLTRVWRTGHGKVEDRLMDEHIVVWGGRSAVLEGGFADINLNSISFFIDKHNKYATREAIQVLIERYKLRSVNEALQGGDLVLQARIKRWIKKRVFERINFGLSSLLYFLWRYLFQLGFLDGREGLIYHFLQGGWYRFLVGSKIEEFERQIRQSDLAGAQIEEIMHLGGLSRK